MNLTEGSGHSYLGHPSESTRTKFVILERIQVLCPSRHFPCSPWYANCFNFASAGLLFFHFFFLCRMIRFVRFLSMKCIISGRTRSETMLSQSKRSRINGYFRSSSLPIFSSSLFPALSVILFFLILFLPTSWASS